MSEREHHERMPDVLRGAAALWEMLNLIGEPEKSDHDLARIFTENEMEIRALVAFMPSVLGGTSI